MKRFLKITFSVLSIVSVAIIISSCDKDDDDEKKPYYGDWESNVYPLVDALSGDTLAYEKMAFNFTNTTFSDEISNGTSPAQVVPSLTMAGDIENPSAGLLKVEINKLIIAGAEISASSQAELFESSFNQFLSSRLSKSFDAKYTISGDTMVLTMPTKSGDSTVDTNLKLYKK